MKEHFKFLGLRVEDIVTGYKGVVTSICFDLFGCVQCAVNPGVDKDGKQQDAHWYDAKRLRSTSSLPVMDLPDFAVVPGGDNDKPMCPGS